MSIFIIKDNNEIYRIRKEESGCTIFSSKFYIEGDDILYDILRRVSEFGVKQSISDILTEYEEDHEVIKADLIELADSLIENCILVNIANEIKKTLKTN